LPAEVWQKHLTKAGLGHQRFAGHGTIAQRHHLELLRMDHLHAITSASFGGTEIWG
jgi:hypothetical protein